MERSLPSVITVDGASNVLAPILLLPIWANDDNLGFYSTLGIVSPKSANSHLDRH